MKCEMEIGKIEKENHYFYNPNHSNHHHTNHHQTKHH